MADEVKDKILVPCPTCGRQQYQGIFIKLRIELKALKKRFGEDSPICRGYRAAINDMKKEYNKRKPE